MTESQKTEGGGVTPFPVRELRRGLAILIAAFAVAILVAGIVGNVRFGVWGLIAAVVAGSSSLFCMALALVVSCLSRKPESSVNGMLLSTLVRTVPPLALLAWLGTGTSRLAVSGFSANLVGFYLFGLVVETALSLWVLKSSGASGISSIALIATVEPTKASSRRAAIAFDGLNSATSSFFRQCASSRCSISA